MLNAIKLVEKYMWLFDNAGAIVIAANVNSLWLYSFKHYALQLKSRDRLGSTHEMTPHEIKLLNFVKTLETIDVQ